ncbi:MAG: type II toxin-antitoxin system ParD family antitoxin [Crocosphaera sp.]|nr:type II toxin-antitoxin system ParD family antitoxin [Crocosphaera sp.]
MMTNLNISLSDTMREFIDQQLQAKGYSSADEYIVDLIRQEQEKEAQKQIEKLLLEGLNSGEPIEMTEEWWTNKRKEVIDRINQD